MEQRVQFSSDGLKLSGVLHLPEGLKKGERRPAFMVLHGFGSNKDSSVPSAATKLFTSLGYVVLCFDMRGCGESEGERGRTICLEQVEESRELQAAGSELHAFGHACQHKPCAFSL